MRRVLATLAAVALLGLAAAAIVVGGGLYDISATDQHLPPTHWALETASRQAVRLRARSIDVPPLDDAARVGRGLSLYREHCATCHGAPGVAPEPFALGMTPVPANLVDTARKWKPAEIYWTVRNGFKMTGMPAWEFRLPDEDLWNVVAFVRTLPALSPDEYRRRAAGAPRAERREERFSGPPDPKRGAVAIEQYGCATCHEIPGIVGANKAVGPPLAGIAGRAVLAGIVPNDDVNMVRWLRKPQEISPESAMPDLGVTERDARDIAAYLSTLPSRSAAK